MLGSFIEVDIDVFELLLFLFVFLFFLLQLLFDLPRFLFQIFLLIRVVINVHIMAPLCDFGCIESSTSIESRYRFSRIYGLRIGFLDLVVDAILFDVLLFISAVIEKRLVFDVVVNDEIVVLSDSLVGLTIVEVVVFGRVRMWVCLFEGKNCSPSCWSRCTIKSRGRSEIWTNAYRLVCLHSGRSFDSDFGCFFKELQWVISDRCLLVVISIEANQGYYRSEHLRSFRYVPLPFFFHLLLAGQTLY